MTMDVRTAREAAVIRGRGALGGVVLSGLLVLGTAAFAATGPPEVAAFLWAAAGVALVGLVGCLLVFLANRRLAADPTDRGPLGLVVAASVVVVLAWTLAVVAVLATTADAAFVLAALGLFTLTLPTLVLSLITSKGPHPEPAAS